MNDSIHLPAALWTASLVAAMVIAMKATIVTIDLAGRVVVPKRFREQYRLRAGSRLQLEAAEDGFRLTPLDQQPALVRENGWWVHEGTAEEPLEGSVAEHRARRLDSFR